jgi:hypothetical protein
MESPGEPFSPVVMQDLSKQAVTEQIGEVPVELEPSKQEESDPLFEQTGSVLVVSEQKEEIQKPQLDEEKIEETEPEQSPPEEIVEAVKEPDFVTSGDKVVSPVTPVQPDRASDFTSMGNWPLRVVKTESELNPPRAILGLPNGKEVVIKPGMQLVEEGLVVMSIGKRGVVLAKISAQGDHAQIENITLPSLND